MPEPDRQYVTLVNLAGGAAPELFAEELKRVLSNIEDRNTDAEAARKITLEVIFHPKEDRVECACEIKIGSKLAGITAATTNLVLGRSAGRSFALEHDPRQLLLEIPPAQNVVSIGGKAEGEGA